MRRIVIVLVLSLFAAAICAQTSSAAAGAAEAPHRAARASNPVDLNHATMDELLNVPGMTSSWAERILHFRPYSTRLDLLQEGVLPRSVYDRIKDGVIVHREKK